LVWNKEELPRQQKESTVATIHKDGDTLDGRNYRGISLLSDSYKCNILLSRLIPHADKIIADYQCGFRHNRSTVQIFYIRHILEK
jgi:hypothetical protein